MNSRDIITRPVVSLSLGETIGKIRYPILDPLKQQVIGFVVDTEKWFLEPRILLFSLVRGMGNEIVTVENESSLTLISDLLIIQKQLNENVQIIGHKVISESGKVVGYIEEFSFNHLTGSIETYKIKDKDYSVNSQEIICIGKEFVVVKEIVVSRFAGVSNLISVPENNVNSIFERRQIQFILGKKLSRNLEAEGGSLIAQEGEIIDEDIIEKAKSESKFTELVMSIEADI